MAELLRLSKEKRIALGKDLQEMIQQAIDVRMVIEPRWRQCDKVYFGEPMPSLVPPWKGAPVYNYPILQTKLDQVSAFTVGAVTNMNPYMLVRAGGYGFYEATATNRGINSNYITSAAAWKIREIALTYDVPAAAMRKAKFVKGASVGLVARNVFTFLPSTNQWTDPEFANTTGNAGGVNNSSILPPNRLYGFNISLRF